jgi:hypothetical protein
MTRKDYEFIAGIIASLSPVVSDAMIRYIARAFADCLQDTNPRFDKTRFVVACGKG